MQKLIDLEPEIRAAAEHRPLSVKAIIITEDDKILLLKRPNEGRWDLPGGGVDDGENLPQAIIREVSEEAGLDIDNALPVYTYLRSVKSKPEKLIQFVLSRINTPSVELNIRLSDEHESYRFFDFGDMATLQIVPSYLEALHHARREYNKIKDPL